MSEHVREHHSLLAAAEKRLLIRMASHLPASIHSDHLTVLALAAMALAGLGFWLARWDSNWLWVVVGALAVNWFGDSLDGTLARLRRVERPRYGFYVDHVLDIVGITFLLTGLACSGFMTPVIALSLLVAYLLVSGEVFLATAVRGVFRMSFAGMGPTELRILLSVGAIALRGDPHVSFGALGRAQLFDVGGVVAIAGLLVALVWAIVKNTSALARLEPRPRPNHATAKRVAVAFFALAALMWGRPAVAQQLDRTLDEQVRAVQLSPRALTRTVRQHRDPIWNGAAIGAVVGAVAAVGMLNASSGCDCARGQFTTKFVLPYAAVGFAAGAMVDAAIYSRTESYRPPPPRAQFRVSYRF